MAFATYTDIGVRLETTLSAQQQANATQLCAEATALICDAVDREEADITNAETAKVLKGLAIKLVCRTMASPQGLTSAQEALGQFSRTERYGEDGMMLTQAEERLARSAVYGTLSGSSTPRSLDDRLIDLREGRDVDELVVD